MMIRKVEQIHLSERGSHHRKVLG